MNGKQGCVDIIYTLLVADRIHLSRALYSFSASSSKRDMVASFCSKGRSLLESEDIDLMS